MTNTLQALALADKAESVLLRFTLHLRDQRSMWMHDGCKPYMNSYMALSGSCIMVHLDYFQKPPLGHRPDTKLGNHGTPNAQNHWLILLYHAWGPTWINFHWNSIWLRARSHMTSQYTQETVTTLHDFEGVLWRPLDAFFWGLAQFYHGHGFWLVCEVALI